MDRRRSSTPLPDPRAWKDVDELLASVVRQFNAMRQQYEAVRQGLETLRAGVPSVEATDIPAASIDAPGLSQCPVCLGPRRIDSYECYGWPKAEGC